ncbi:aminomethyl-transferring glycine dehydrogenase subunit GcvPA [Endothiovibrio diazotrophicus]
MPFIPHTEEDVRAMLGAIGAETTETLFDEIPAALRAKPLEGIGRGLSEMEIGRLMEERAERDGRYRCFIGAGAYEHHIPAAVWEIASRGEFYTAYTPYQAEASQGTLQLLYEFQTMMAELTAMEVSNASLYDGASGLAEAVLMAVRANRKSHSKRVLMPTTVHPAYRAAVKSIVGNQGIELVELPYDPQGGHTDPALLAPYAGQDIAALVIPQPNFFGVLEEADALTDWARENHALSIALVNPLALALLSPPGEWGSEGADIAVGEGQPLGAPLASGGPYFGFLTCKQALVRQMPGRIVGRTVDLDGKEGFTLTLQAREQHIRRSKATSNICTNQGLMATAATIHLTLLGAEGLKRTAIACHANTNRLVERLTAVERVEAVFDRPRFHEAVLRVDADWATVARALEVQGIVGGYPLGDDYPELAGCVLVCATETKTEADLDDYARHLERIVSRQQPFVCPNKRPRDA